MHYRINHDLLSKRIEECGFTKETVADRIGIARSTFNRRLKNSKLLIGDMRKLCKVLNLSGPEATEVFLVEVGDEQDQETDTRYKDYPTAEVAKMFSCLSKEIQDELLSIMDAMVKKNQKAQV